MRLLRFDPEVCVRITHHASSFLHIFLSRASGDVRVSCMHFSPGDHVGRHEALLPQLFAVVAGGGWVEGDAERSVVGPGVAALWVQGEWHAAGTESGMTAVVIEAEALDLRFLPELHS
jgi:quercetin dioxygenase-like cupin family protein